MSSRNLLWQLPLLVLLTMPVWWGFAAEFLRFERRVLTSGEETVTSFEMEGVVLSQSKLGVEEMVLNTKRLYSKDDQKILYFDGVEVLLLGDGKPMEVKGGSAVYNTRQQVMTIMDDVRLVTADNYIMKTPVMRYLTKYKKIKSAESVEFKGERLQISGRSFMYDLDTGNFRVGSRVRCLFQ